MPKMVDLNRKEIFILIIIGVLILSIPVILVGGPSIISFKDTGQIGDTIGGITAPFLGFFGSILVYLTLRAQITANKKIQNQFDEQKIIDYRQNFENTFFNLLSIHHQIVENIDVESEKLIPLEEKLFADYISNQKHGYKTADLQGKTYESRDVFKYSLKVLQQLIFDDLYFTGQLDLKNYYPSEYEAEYSKRFNTLGFKSKIISSGSETLTSKFDSIYDVIYGNLNADLGHYFRNIYRIIKMVDEKKFSNSIEDDFLIKYSYTSIIRSQLSDDEIKWLFFNCLSKKGSEKFKPFIEKYTLLKLIPRNTEPVFIKYSKFYKESAFRKPKDLKEHLEI